MPSSPGRGGRAASSSGSTLPGSSPRGRVSSTNAGWRGSINSPIWRELATRCTSGKAAARAGKSGGSTDWSLPALLPLPLLPPAARAYSSAGNTPSSQSLTAARKLATITVSATDKARLATTPATIALALWRA